MNDSIQTKEPNKYFDRNRAVDREWFIQDTNKLILGNNLDKPNANILVAECNTGFSVFYIAQQTEHAHIKSYDIKSYAEYVKKNYCPQATHLTSQLEYETIMDINSLPSATNGKWDIIISDSRLSRISRYSQPIILKVINQSLEPGGFFFGHVCAVNDCLYYNPLIVQLFPVLLPPNWFFRMA
jgi:hypothetical protein